MNRKGDDLVSYSMMEPDWPLICECKYDAVQDTLDREDCLLHFDMEEEIALPQEHQPPEYRTPEPQAARKKPATIVRRNEENMENVA
jgi:hypothetical protein